MTRPTPAKTRQERMRDEFVSAPLWRCLEIALFDLELCEASPQYVIDMSAWHWRHEDASETCVCLAGAVLAQTGGVDPSESLDAENYGNQQWADRLFALDYLRLGHIYAACQLVGARLGNLPPAFSVTSYDISADEFKSDIRLLVKLLKEAGV